MAYLFVTRPWALLRTSVSHLFFVVSLTILQGLEYGAAQNLLAGWVAPHGSSAMGALQLDRGGFDS